MSGRRRTWAWNTVPNAALPLWLVLVPWCGQAEGPTATQAKAKAKAEAEAPAVLWGGCQEIRLSPRGEPEACLLDRLGDEGPIFTAWVPSDASELMATLDGEPLEILAQTMVDGGTSFSVRPKHTGHLELTGEVDGARTVLLALDVGEQPLPDPSFKARLDAALDDPAARNALEHEVRRHLDDARSPEARLLHTEQLGHVLYDQGQLARSAAAKLEAARMARALGQPLRECASAWSASFLYGESLGKHAEAQRVFDELCDYEAKVPLAAMMGGYYEGLLELHLGQLERARRSIEHTVEIARRLRWRGWERVAINPLSQVLASQGRFRWADLLLRRAEVLVPSRDSTNPLRHCEAVANNLRSRSSLALREARLLGRPTTAARALLEQTRALYLDRTRCPEHHAVVSALALVDTRLVRLDLDAGLVDDAAARLASIDEGDLTTTNLIHLRLLQIELMLERSDRALARRALRALGAEIDGGTLADAVEPEQRWRWSLLEARLHQANGDLTGAIASLARAQALLERTAQAARSAVEADRRAAMQREGSQLLVHLLVEAGQLEPALCAARISRVRGLIGLEPDSADSRASLEEARDRRRDRLSDYRWYEAGRVPAHALMEIETGLDDLMTALPMSPRVVRCQDLPAPRPGEVSLLPFHDGQRWIGFAWGADGRPTVEPLAPEVAQGDPSARGEALLAPFASVLDGATRLRVLLPSSFHDVSVPDLRWPTPLADRPTDLPADPPADPRVGDEIAVVYGLDLPVVERVASDHSAALVFSDPHLALDADLPALQARFESWAALLRRHGWPIDFDRSPREGSSPPSVDEVLRGTETVDLALLYGFGGGERSYYDLLPDPSEPADDRTEPDQRSFVLDAAGLVRSDILLHRGRVPRHVILALCSSAEVDPYGISGAVGLAQSYVQAGAEWAVGTSDRVDPETMAQVVEHLIAGYPIDPSADGIAEALQQAKRDLEDLDLPHGDRLRLWVP